MKKSFWSRSALALALGVGLSGLQLKAQEAPVPTDPSQQPTSQQPQPPTQDPSRQDPSAQPPAQTAPDAQAQSTTDGQVFTGTIMKSGDKFVLQAANGTSYDIDQQDMVKKYEGKQVRINGTLDADGKTIHVK